MHTNGSPAAVARRYGNDPGIAGDPAQDQPHAQHKVQAEDLQQILSQGHAQQRQAGEQCAQHIGLDQAE